MSFFNELKRRNVVRMGVLYIVASWVVLQISDVIFDPLGVPSWVFRLLMSLLALGFPFALIFSWIFELTPEGLKLERDIDRSQSIVHQTGHRMNTVIVVLLVLAIGGLIADRLVPETVAPGDAGPEPGCGFPVAGLLVSGPWIQDAWSVNHRLPYALFRLHADDVRFFPERHGWV